MVRVINKLTFALREAASFNPDVQSEPHCILWTDRDRQWESIIQRLQEELPELFVFGKYEPGKRTGPAIWLRCVIAGKVEETPAPANRKIIVYLPGVSKQELRAVEACAEELKPIAELQYRGSMWTQIANGKDWTVLAFLKSNQGGLGLEVAQDQETKIAMLLSLYRLLDEDVELLANRHLDKDYFNGLLTKRDHVREVLQWLDQGDAYRAEQEKNAWKAFVALCRSQLGFDPDKEGVLAGGTKLAKHEGPWQAVWERFCESPRRYPKIPSLLRRCQPPKGDMLWPVADVQYSGWPQWNDEQEDKLRGDLLSLAETPAKEARSRILDLESRHKNRRTLVWAELGEAQLALALESIAILAQVTGDSLCAGTCDDLAAGYQTFGWKADDAVLRALSTTDKEEDYAAVSGAVRAIYVPWIEESARYLQQVVEKNGYPGGSVYSARKASSYAGECILFVDGLRLDVAKQLAGKFAETNCCVSERVVWAALPSVTPTGKPAVSPVREKIRGLEANADFEPIVAETGQSLKGGYHIKKLLTEGGWEVLERSAYGAGQGNAWCEFGNIDAAGHENGWKLSKQLNSLIEEIQNRVIQLLRNGGWKTVRIVTDHGWLLVPGGLPKQELPSALAENKWGRCAAIKSGARTEERLYPWFWNPGQYFALADGISCFRKGEEYAHGGLSLQECLTLELNVSLAKGSAPSDIVEITDIGWKGLRCSIAIEGDPAGLQADLRKAAGNPSTSIVVTTKGFKNNGTTSLVVEDENLEGNEAFVVILSSDGAILSQRNTCVGGIKE
jgi:hypothetical protein